MKRIVCLLVVCLALIAVGCGSRKTPAGRHPSYGPPPADAGKTVEKPERKEPGKSVAAPVPARPAAAELLKSVRKTYSSLRSLRQDGKSVTLARADGKVVGKPQHDSLSLLFKRPDRFVIVTSKGKLVSDGKTVYSYNNGAKQYVKSKPGEVVSNLIVSRPGIGTVGLLYGAKYDKAIGTCKLLPDATLDGHDVYVLAIQLKNGPGAKGDVRGIETLWIDKKDLGLRRMQIILAYKPKPSAGAKGRTTPKLIESETTTDFRTFEPNVKVANSAFAFKPPAGAKLLQPPKPVDIYGKPAPDFVFIWVDGHTKKLSDFASKYVLLNFWALPMCEQQLPILQGLNTGLDHETQLITVNLNSNRDEVQEYLKKKGYTFPVVYVTPETARIFSEGYGLRGLPTMFILDKHGFVRSQLMGVPDKAEIEKKLAEVRK